MGSLFSPESRWPIVSRSCFLLRTRNPTAGLAASLPRDHWRLIVYLRRRNRLLAQVSEKLEVLSRMEAVPK